MRWSCHRPRGVLQLPSLQTGLLGDKRLAVGERVRCTSVMLSFVGQATFTYGTHASEMAMLLSEKRLVPGRDKVCHVGSIPKYL